MSCTVLGSMAAIWLALVGVVGEQPGRSPTAQSPAGAPKLLRVGDAAPKVGHVEWLKGEPVDLNDRKHVYLMEFWATWCGPCVQQIPHLNDLQKKFEDRGLVVVGMNSGDKDERAAREFVSKRGDSLGYRIAYDADRSVWREFAQAGGVDAIPLLLVIDRTGKIAYFDQPKPDFDTIVERVLNGAWDPGKDKPAESRKSVIAREVRAKVKSGDFDGAYGLLDREAAADPGLAGYAAKLKFKVAYFDRQDWGAARAFAVGMLEGPAGKDADSLADVADWMINEGAPPVREYSVATKLATRAVELTGAKDGPILDILARCHLQQGNLERAVELQTKAVDLMPEGQAKANMAETLRLMKERQEEKHKVEKK